MAVSLLWNSNYWTYNKTKKQVFTIKIWLYGRMEESDWTWCISCSDLKEYVILIMLYPVYNLVNLMSKNVTSEASDSKCARVMPMAQNISFSSHTVPSDKIHFRIKYTRF